MGGCAGSLAACVCTRCASGSSSFRRVIRYSVWRFRAGGRGRQAPTQCPRVAPPETRRTGFRWRHRNQFPPAWKSGCPTRGQPNMPATSPSHVGSVLLWGAVTSFIFSPSWHHADTVPARLTLLVNDELRLERAGARDVGDAVSASRRLASRRAARVLRRWSAADGRETARSRSWKSRCWWTGRHPSR